MIRKQLSKLQKLISYYKEYRDESSILIYQMGKVGSTSIEKSLPSSIHIHSLFNNPPCFVHLKQRRVGLLSSIEGWVADGVKRLAIKNRKNIKIISLVRDPFKRDISMFFQNLPQWLYEYTGTHEVDTREEGLSILIDAFQKTYDYDYALRWFDLELKKLTGVDIFDFDFDVSKGYLEIHSGRYSILLLKLETISAANGVLNEFCGQEIEIITANSGNKKWYAPVYDDFKRTAFQSDEYVGKVKQSKLYKHFYCQSD